MYSVKCSLVHLAQCLPPPVSWFVYCQKATVTLLSPTSLTLNNSFARTLARSHRPENTTSDPASLPTTPFHFVNLPIELRLYVYEQLVVGRIFYTSNDYPVDDKVHYNNYD
jgi:hypothetical protein